MLQSNLNISQISTNSSEQLNWLIKLWLIVVTIVVEHCTALSAVDIGPP